VRLRGSDPPPPPPPPVQQHAACAPPASRLFAVGSSHQCDSQGRALAHPPPPHMVVSRCRGIGPPSSGIVLGTLFILAANLRRHPTYRHLGPSPLYCLIYWVNPRGRVALWCFCGWCVAGCLRCSSHQYDRQDSVSVLPPPPHILGLPRGASSLFSPSFLSRWRTRPYRSPAASRPHRVAEREREERGHVAL